MIRNEYQKLVQSIILTQEENYDCQKQNVWSYRKSNDIRDGISIKFGNMVNGFPFHVQMVSFINSETAYIAGAYAGSDNSSIEIQQLISKENNGQGCKRIYRNNPKFTQHMRQDFFEYNVQWMLFVLWQKSLGNSDFNQLLRKIPINADVVEDTSRHTGKSATFWGAKNKELLILRKKVEKLILENSDMFKTKKDREEAQMQAMNSINKVGHFEGFNVMGKIIKMCSLAVIYDQNPPIDYELLKSKNLFLLGESMDFISPPRSNIYNSKAS